MDVIALRTTLVKMFLALQVHQVKFVNQAVALEQAECAIDGDAVNPGIHFAGAAQDLAGVEMLLRGFHHT